MSEQGFLRHSHRRGADRLVETLVQALAHAREAEAVARRPGILQALDPRTKLICFLGLIATAVAARSLLILAFLLALATLLAAASAISPRRLARPLWLGVLVFTGTIALPALVLVPGPAALALPFATVTWPGLRSAGFLVLRAETSASFALILILTTPWPHLLKALRRLGMPAALVMILGMTERYIFTLAETATRMAEGRESRRIGRLDGRARRRLAGAAAGALFLRSLETAEEVHQAMLSRGWRGEPVLLDDFRFSAKDFQAFFATALVIAAALIWGWT